MPSSNRSLGRIRAALHFVGLGAAISLVCGCMCGAAAVPTAPSDDKGGMVDSAGVVIFNHTEVGDTATFDVPIHDSADVDETLMGVTISGPDADAFDANAKFPIVMDAGSIVHIEVSFHPLRSGEMKAELMVKTKEMGISPIEIEGLGIDARDD